MASREKCNAIFSRDSRRVRCQISVLRASSRLGAGLFIRSSTRLVRRVELWWSRGMGHRISNSGETIAPLISYKISIERNFSFSLSKIIKKKEKGFFNLR